LYFVIALRTDALHHIFCLFYLETCRQWYRGDVNVFQAEGAMTTATGQMHMTITLSCIVQMADTVFL
jgi:hypothetical protein